MDEKYDRDEALKDRQDDRTFRVGRVLRGTFDGPPDEVLEPKLTRLMLELSHLPDDRDQPQLVAAPVAEPLSLLRRIASRLSLR